MNAVANVVKLNQHLKMDVEILEKALNEIMVCKTFNGSVSILKNRNCYEGLGTKLVLRCNNSRRTSETSFHSIHKNESRKSNQTNALKTLGVRPLVDKRNAAL